QRALDYPATAEQTARWAKVLPADATLKGPAPSALDPDGGVRAAIAAAITPLLPAPPAPLAFDPKPTEVPLVKVVVDGGTFFANPNLDGAAFGQTLTQGAPEPAPEATGERTITVTVSGARSSQPKTAFTLAQHTWKASEVAGRTITAAFATPMSRTDAARTKVSAANAFIPMLVVRGDGLDLAQSQALSAVGTPVLRDGALVTAGPNGHVVIDGEPVSLGPTADAVLSSVQTLTADVSAAAFPDVELLVSAKSGAGAAVSDLGADAFVIKEGGVTMPALLKRTRAGAPRVVLLFDRSSSIPSEFLTGAASVGHSVADAVFTQFPGAQVQVAGIDINGPTVAGAMVSTLTDVDTQLAALSGAGSEVWTSLDFFATTKATLVVVITDATVDDTLSPEAAARLVAGPPVLVAGVGTVDATTAARMASLTHGQVLSNVSASGLAASVTGFLSGRVPFDYRIVYRAPVAGFTQRQVTVSLRAPGVATLSTSYTPPSTPVEASALSALYLTVETDGHEVTRTLAGSALGSAADREAVAGALFGRAVLAVEAGPPSLSTLLDEHLTERLQLEPLIDALRGTDQAAVIEAQKRTLFRVPPALRFFSAALPGEASTDDVTFADGLTATLSVTRPQLGVKVVKRFDLLPLVPRRTVSFSGAQTYVTTVQRTAAMAAFESARFATNTAKALAGKTLARFDASSVEALGPNWVGAAYPTYSDYHVLAPSDGSVVAFWAVHQQTGEVIGVLPGGGLGEDESTEALVDRLLSILDAAGRAGEAAGYNGVKEWADLEATKVQLLGGVIMLFEGEGSDPRGDLVHNTCNFFTDQLGGQIPGWNELGGLAGDLQSLYDLLGRLFGREMPDVPTPGGQTCSALGF
ncbi:MAG: hypothetical protein K1X89_30480, partial [Myxococcaceae bacterium]|nr:hypothetical protein [Myxococcaceae bacterium]